MGKADWVRAYDGTTVHGKPPYTLECKRCGIQESPSLPITISRFVAIASKFERFHKKCKERPHVTKGDARK